MTHSEILKTSQRYKKMKRYIYICIYIKQQINHLIMTRRVQNSVVSHFLSRLYHSDVDNINGLNGNSSGLLIPSTRGQLSSVNHTSEHRPLHKPHNGSLSVSAGTVGPKTGTLSCLLSKDVFVGKDHHVVWAEEEIWKRDYLINPELGQRSARRVFHVLKYEQKRSCLSRQSGI